MTFNISYNIEAIDKFSATSRKIDNSITKLTEKLDRMGSRLRSVGEKFSHLGKNMTLRVTTPIVAAGTAAVVAAGKFETMETQFSSIFHSAKKAKKFVKDLMDFTGKTPFRIPEMAKTAQELLHAGVPMDKIQQKLQMLGDTASGAGLTMERQREDLIQLGAIYARIGLQGRAYFRDIKQLTYIGTPAAKVIQQMAKEAGLGNVTVLKLASAGALTAKVMDEVFRRMTHGMGMFTDQMLKQSKTLFGRLSTLHDNFNMMLRPIGDAIMDVLALKRRIKELTDVIIKLRPAIEVFVKTHKTLTKIIIYLAGMTALLPPILISISLILFAFSAIISPVALIGTALIGIGATLGYLYLTSDKFRKNINIIAKSMKLWIPVFKDLYLMSKNVLLFFWEMQKASMKTGIILVKFIFKPWWKFIKMLYNTLLPLIKVIGKVLYYTFVLPIKGIISSIKWLHSMFADKKSPLTISHETAAIGKISPWKTLGKGMPIDLSPQKVKSEMQISVYDPTKIIRSISGRGDGIMNFNLGTNMVGSTT